MLSGACQALLTATDSPLTAYATGSRNEVSCSPIGCEEDRRCRPLLTQSRRLEAPSG